MSEYLPNGNGHSNGNGHQKVFELTRTIDSDTIAVLEARRACRADQRLNRSMKACFDEIADRALNPSFYDAKGVVTISDTALAEIFCVSNRTIYSWKHQIAQCGYVWLGKKFKSNMWPLTTYHLSCLHKKPAMQRTDSDGTYGARRFRSAPVNPGLGARQPGQPILPLAGSRNGNGDHKSADLLAISAEGRKNVPLSPEENFGSEPKPASGESRNGFRARAEESFGSEPKPVAGESRSGTPARAEADCRLKKAKVEGKGILKGVGAPPAADLDVERAFKEWEKRLDDMRNSDLRKLDEIVTREYQDARSAEAKANARHKLRAIRLRLRGPSVPDEAPKPKPTRKAPQVEKPMTEEEILTSALQTINAAKAAGIKPLLTEKQQAILAANGQL